jgi:hypothetical protein
VIESFGYNFAQQSYHPDDHTTAVRSIEEKIDQYYPDATVYRFHTGQVYHFKGMSIEILATQEEVYPLVAVSEQNDLCVNCRVMLENGKTAIFLADASVDNNKALVSIYGSYLKSDILQVAHHGLFGAEMTCYKAIDPDICLWPSPYARFMNLHPGQVVFSNGGDSANVLKVNKDQWGLAYCYVLNEAGQPIDMEGNPTDDPAKAKKMVISDANLWLFDESVKVRCDYHNNETTIIGADMSVTVQRVQDSDLLYAQPENEEHFVKIGEFVDEETGFAYVIYDATGYDYKSLDDIPGGIETILNRELYFK